MALDTGKVPVLLNINQAIESAAASQLAALAQASEWLRLDEPLADPDTYRPTDCWRLTSVGWRAPRSSLPPDGEAGGVQSAALRKNAGISKSSIPDSLSALTWPSAEARPACWRREITAAAAGFDFVPRP